MTIIATPIADTGAIGSTTDANDEGEVCGSFGPCGNNAIAGIAIAGIAIAGVGYLFDPVINTGTIQAT